MADGFIQLINYLLPGCLQCYYLGTLIVLITATELWRDNFFSIYFYLSHKVLNLVIMWGDCSVLRYLPVEIQTTYKLQVQRIGWSTLCTSETSKTYSVFPKIKIFFPFWLYVCNKLINWAINNATDSFCQFNNSVNFNRFILPIVWIKLKSYTVNLKLNYDTLNTYVLSTENNYYVTFHENFPMYSQSL